MARSLLDDRSLIPAFHLLGRGGIPFDSLELKRKKNLVLFFLSSPEKDFFLKAEEAWPSLKDQNAEVAVIGPLGPEAVDDIYRKNRFSFAILADAAGEVRKKFIEAQEGESFAGLFITDKFGDIFFQALARQPAELPPFADIARSLVFIESQCPECSGGL